MSTVRIAVVGAGNWGRNHVRTLASMADVELAAVCDTDDERRAELSRQYPGLRVTDSLDVAFDGADGVVVATPVLSHVPVAREALQRGLPALIEKPMARSVDEAKELVDLVDETGVPVVSGHLLVFHPAIEYLQKII
ncbi:MAG: Gfo/Idh/MocA family oxidoreductase, partial [Gemmatimonadetes bacterium]|nr:Gfo/Idh/MocA family oxidoreductase [Gemmatimonadota bacterium]